MRINLQTPPLYCWKCKDHKQHDKWSEIKFQGIDAPRKVQTYKQCLVCGTIEEVTLKWDKSAQL